MKKNILLTCLMLTIQLSIMGQRKQEAVTTGLYGEKDKITVLTIEFEKGKSHNHPLMAIWLADENGKYIQTLYVAESIGKGYFKRANRSTGMWQAGEIQRPATLPYWAHQRGLKNELGTYMPTKTQAVPDAYTGATPVGSFVFHLITKERLSGIYKVYMEINQSWDWNDYWHNAKFPDDKEYKTSSQPAIVYEAIIDTHQSGSVVALKAIGHSHYAGKDGKLYTNLETLSSALNIVKKCTVKIE
jgi:hypothetical protein